MSVSNRLYKREKDIPPNQPLPWRVYCKQVLMKDAVLRISLSLAALSILATRPPLATCAVYIDARTLACLLCLMTASGGFMISGVFDLGAARLVNRCGTSRSLAAAMIFSVFFASMLVTNDVALIVFVPMTLLAFRTARLDPTLTVVLQTIAANVGSILLPMGNPQNLYLYSRYRMDFPAFAATVFPLFAAGLVLLALFCALRRGTPLACARATEPTVRPRNAALFGGLFIIALLAVFGALDYRVACIPAVIVMIMKGRNLVQQIDFPLLLTFIGFFIFAGNIAHIPAIESALKNFVEPRPFWAAVAASQIISNVPAAIVLSGFSDNAHALLAGVSAGGCGTLVASMASLISYKLFIRDGREKKRFLILFTLLNLLFLAAMTAAYLFFAAP